MKDKKAIPTLTDKEFKELLKSWGAKNMESFDINNVFDFSVSQKKEIKRMLDKEVQNEKNK